MLAVRYFEDSFKRFLRTTIYPHYFKIMLCAWVPFLALLCVSLIIHVPVVVYLIAIALGYVCVHLAMKSIIAEATYMDMTDGNLPVIQEDRETSTERLAMFGAPLSSPEDSVPSQVVSDNEFEELRTKFEATIHPDVRETHAFMIAQIWQQMIDIYTHNRRPHYPK